MKNLFLIAAFIFSGLVTNAQEKHTVTLEFQGMNSDKGNLYVAVYNKEDSFLKKPIKGTIVNLK